MRCLIADDEEHARQYLIALLSQHPKVEIVGLASSGREALDMAQSLSFELAFLDISMPEVSGIQVARSFGLLARPPGIIFLTAHSEHAAEAFDIGVIDYLLKPVQPERLQRSLQRLEDSQRGVEIKPKQPEPCLNRVWVTHPVSQVQEIVSLDEIGCFWASDDLVWAEVRGESFRVSLSLTRLQERLSPELFLRTHKAFIVNLNKVRRLITLSRRNYILVLECGREVPLSRHFYEDFRVRVPGL